MGIELKTGFLGLLTNTADLQAPPGALERASNVVIRRAGAIETRPGVRPWGNPKANPTRPLKIVPYEEKSIAYLLGQQWWDLNNNALLQFDPPDGSADYSPPAFRRDLIPHAQTRGNLYLGAQQGTLKWAGGSTLVTAGIPLLASISAQASIVGTFLPNNSQVAYSIVLRRTDSNGLIIRSRPTGAAIVSNTSGAARSANITIRSPMGTSMFDTIEIYRTRIFSTSVTPDAEMQLVTNLPWTGSGVASYNDNLADSARTGILYTSPSREGDEGANDLAPAAGALAVFKGALFFGNTAGPERKTFSFNWLGDRSGQATGIGWRNYTGDTTNGLSTITNLSSTVGLQIGQMVYGTGISSETRWIIGIAGTTVTLNGTVSATQVAGSFFFEDGISLDGGTTYVNSRYAAIQGAFYTGSSFAYRVSPPVPPYSHTFVAQSLYRGPQATLGVLASHGNEYSPALPLGGTTPDDGDQDIYANGLMWSKPDEPEHVPLGNFAFVGDKKRAILALVPARDALFIVKEDGVFRLTGIPGQYRIDPFDLTARCVLPSSVVPLRNKIYMLCSQGIVSVSDQGVENVSRPIQDQLKAMIQNLMLEGTTGDGYVIPASNGISILGYAGAAIERDNEYMLLVEDALEAQRSGIAQGMLVYNAETQAWTSWTFDRNGTYQIVPCTIAWNERNSELMIGQQTDAGTFKRLADPDSVSAAGPEYSSDADVAFTITSSPGSGLTNYVPAILMAVGDVVYTYSDATARRVVTVNTDEQVVLESSPPAGSAQYMRPIVATVRPRAFMAPNQVMKLWTQISAEFSESYGVTEMSFSALSSIVTNSLTLITSPLDAAKVAGVTAYKVAAKLRGLMPRDAARGFKLIAEVSWKAIFGRTTLEGILVETREGKPNAPNLATKVGP